MDLALQCVKRLSGQHPGLRVWAYEVYKGAKNFHVCSKAIFWNKYKKINQNRYYYEIIQSDHSCRLFFDFDVNKELNPLFDADRSMTIFFLYLRAFVYELLEIELTLCDILQLEATTDSKFSKHFVVQSFVFENIAHCGRFVRKMADRLSRSINGSESELLKFAVDEYDEFKVNDLLCLQVNTSNGTSFIFDLNVYKKNQQFRIIHSEKRGKKNPLEVAYDNSLTIFNDTTLFDNSLVSSHHDYVVPDQSENNYVVSVPEVAKRKPQVCRSGCTGNDLLDHFVLQQARKFGGHATLGRISRGDNCIKYDIKGSKWCQYIGREHKSNRIYFVVDLDRCIVSQGCYDNNCRNYESPATKIPASLCPNINLLLGTNDVDLESILSSMPLCPENVPDSDGNVPGSSRQGDSTT